MIMSEALEGCFTDHQWATGMGIMPPLDFILILVHSNIDFPLLIKG